MQLIGYLTFRFFVFLFSLFPFWLIYLIADFTYFLLYKVFKYRVIIVQKNLKKSFPEKNEAEILEIEKKFYKNLSDITIESIKGMSLSKKQLLKRYKVVNLEILQEIYDKGQSVIGVGSHYANWEWGVLAFSLQFPHKCLGIYKPMKNKYIDAYIRKGRAKNGMNLHSIKETRTLFEQKQERPAIYIMVADQSPANLDKAIWINFLNQETACLHGVDYYTQKFNFPVIYGNVQRIKRGFYEVKIELLHTGETKLAEGEITKIFMKHLEDIIRKNPHDWLWSHKRWKHQKK